jgi:fumarylpyruvate hydrolase
MMRLPEFIVRQPTLSVVACDTAAVAVEGIKATTTSAASSSSGSSSNSWKLAGTFPVRRIYCVGRNYEAHAVEMGYAQREPPFFFGKPSHCIVDTFATTSTTHTKDHIMVSIPYPSQTQNFHFEGELVVALGASASDNDRTSRQNQVPSIYGYALGCDLTRRDLQTVAKDKGHPWETAKASDDSAPCGPILPLVDNDLLNPESVLQLSVNGTVRQSAPLNHMIWSVTELLEELSNYFTLQPGDLIFTGTPAGVGPLQVGDVVSIECGPLPPCQFCISERKSSSY